ncbi:MAG: DUF2905 domain-containing protein [Candidatus Makaraimicrobium thalassicum]|nr:MAG: DUF2905 domain-containing protein [Candidatus Omnitrophota bacterium]
MKLAQSIGKFLVISGLVLAALGVIFLLSGKLTWLGKLPGDILIRREKFTFYFPVTTCIAISIILSLVFYLFFKR